MTKRVDQVFGPSPKPRDDSYVDRGKLDEELNRYLKRDVHLVLRGESKCGKSWLRQKTMPDALVVQCRLGRTVSDIYIDILSQLDIRLEIIKKRNGANQR